MKIKPLREVTCTRDMQRRMARTNMEAMGYEKINKKKSMPILENGKVVGYEKQSVFAMKWREHVFIPEAILQKYRNRPKKRRKKK